MTFVDVCCMLNGVSSLVYYRLTLGDVDGGGDGLALRPAGAAAAGRRQEQEHGPRGRSGARHAGQETDGRSVSSPV